MRHAREKAYLYSWKVSDGFYPKLKRKSKELSGMELVVMNELITLRSSTRFVYGSI